MTSKLISLISIYKNIPESAINGSSHIVNDLGMGSLDLLQLLSAFGDSNNIEFSDADIDNLRNLYTIDEMSYYLDGLLTEVKQR